MGAQITGGAGVTKTAGSLCARSRFLTAADRASTGSLQSSNH